MKHKNPPYYTYMSEFPSFHALVEETAGKYAADPAYSYRHHGSDKDAVTVTYAEVAERVRALGTEALARGWQGKHISLIGKLSYGWVTVYLAMLSVGAVLVPLDPDWSEEELADTIAKAECSALFFDEHIREKVEKAAETAGISELFSLSEEAEGATLQSLVTAGAEKRQAGNRAWELVSVDASSLAELVYTSGTTGKGKGVMLSHKALLSNLNGAFAILKISKKTVGVLPPHHTYGSTISLMSAFINGTHTYISSGLKYILSEMAEQQPEHLILVPLYMETFYRRIWAAAEKTGKADLLRRMIKVSNGLRKVGIDLRRQFFGKSVLSAFGGKLTTVICGGAPLSQQIIDAFDDLGIAVKNGYGITECAPLISANRLNYTGDYSVGVPIPDEEIRIDNPNEDGEGEICIRGPHVMMGYFKDEEATAAAIDAEGFFHTGDIGKYENDLVYITGRMKNLIILSNGKNVYPEEIESALLTIPGISEIVVYEGVSQRGADHNAVVAEIYPDKTWFEEHHLEPNEAYFSPFINDYNRHAVPYKKVGFVRIRDKEFPKNTLRKIMRFKIDRTIQ